MIGLGEEVKPHAARLLARMRAPVLTDIKVSGPALLAHAPAAVPDVHAGAPLRLALKLRPEGGDLRVSGRTPGGAWEGRVPVPAVGAGEGTAAVVSLYGREAVEDLEVRRAAGAEVVDRDIERIGLEFQIATRLTSWVAVSDEPGLRRVARATQRMVMHAAGPVPAAFDLEQLGATALGGPAPASYPGRLARRLGLRRESGAATLAARLVLRRDRELTLEIDVEAPFDWEPGEADVRWSDGTTVHAEVVAERTTAAGPAAPGLTMRLTLRLVADPPGAPPVMVVMATKHGPVLINVLRA